ncbi:sugar MFS transporter [Hymenobacter actinosclerus]|uniref:MFS transporter, FHS family, L-fucose permease n=1 Tax=Hymenobacter actinosclerus TaxID=82805 RepID=A0A1I0EM29_9BACT|nr:sugar MFS transporter [Hymenobacter actinosclerus]SET46523.1 MFS transporter, FHS family, L-fucose permease [Hymenobacter actinosclerus]
MAAPVTTIPLPAAASPNAPGTETPNYTPALASLTVLFFMMGFVTVMNDILIPYLKGLFTLSYTEVSLVNFCFFGAYLIMGIPAGSLVKKVGYKNGMLAGFLVAALGAFLFYPAAEGRTFPLFLGALFVLASGIVTLQVAGNPYVSILGPPESASARLTLTQAFNSLATAFGPYVGTKLILSQLPDPKHMTAAQAAALDVVPVQQLYLAVGAIMLLISAILFFIKLPHIAHEPAKEGDTSRAWHSRHLLLGLLGIFTYVGAEVAIGSHIVSYLNQSEVMNLSAEIAGYWVMAYWGGAAVGRFVGTVIMRNIKPNKLLFFNALGAIALILISINTSGELAMYSLLAVGLMNSIMFPVIFTLAVAGLGRHTEDASGLLSASIVGGAIIPLFFGIVADGAIGSGGVHSLRWAFVLPVLCYAYIAWYGLKGHQPAAA